MHGYQISKIAAGAAFTLIFGPVACAEQGQDDPAGRLSDILLEALVEANGVPGMSAALVRDGEAVWLGSAGLRDVERRLPVEVGTQFRFASVSKMITATAAARLAAEGSLDPDAPVQSIIRYLPDIWPPISAWQLAAHTSGIPHYQDVDSGRGGVHFATTEDAVGVFSDRALLAEPGAAYRYSSYGYTLLSAVIEESAGEPFLDHVSRVLLQDLDIGPERSGDRHMATGYNFDADGSLRPVGPHDFSYSWGGAGFRGSARDLALFGARVLSGAAVSPATRALMWTPARLNDGVAARDNPDAEVGFGWRISRDLDGALYVHHAGVMDGARSALVLFPESGDSVSVLSNAQWTASIEQTAMMLVAPYRTASSSDIDAPCPLSVTRFEGSFGSEPVGGAARFELDKGVCRGRISGGNALGVWLNTFPQRDATELQIIAVTPDSALARAALVTPVGIYDLRLQADNVYEARFSATRQLRLEFQ